MPENSKRLIPSLCGTSCLRNGSDGHTQKLLTAYANKKTSGEVPESDRKHLKAHINSVKARVPHLSVEQAGELSAELNTIVRYYGNRMASGGQDYHLFICTETWLGIEAARILETWLSRYTQFEFRAGRDLQTNDFESFHVGLCDLAQALFKELQGYQEHGYKIVFNLTGGFKSIQGFLQTIGMYYADEVLYVFESGESLMRIPRIPVKIDMHEEVKENITVFRRLVNGLHVVDTGGLAGIYLIKMDGDVTLSAWGMLVWDQLKGQVYSEKVWPVCSDKIAASEKFQSSVKSLPADRSVLINKTIDQLAVYFEKGGNLNSLNFKPVKGSAKGPVTHECYAWSDKGAKRIYGYFENRKFVLDHLGDHL